MQAKENFLTPFRHANQDHDTYDDLECLMRLAEALAKLGPAERAIFMQALRLITGQRAAE